MENRIASIRSCFFGLNREMVKSELKKMEDIQNSKLKKIKQQIEDTKRENEILFQGLEGLKKQKETEVKSEEFMDFALKKSGEYIDLLYDASAREVKELTSIGEKTESIFNGKIAEFEQTIKETQSKLDSLLKVILNSNEDLNEKLRTFIKQNETIKFLPNKTIENNIKSEDSNDSNGYVDKNKNDASKADSFYDLKKDNLDEKEISDINVVFSKGLEEGMESYPEDTDNGKSDKEIFSSHDFWGEELNEIKEVNNNVETDKDEKNNDNKLSKIDENNLKISSPGSKALSNDINNLRHKYLIGKITGSDLLDNNGDVIVHKNSVITNEIIDKAEKEGKLADLIVNMTIPDVQV